MKRIFALFVVLFALLEASCANDAAFEIHFIDVGQGDAALVLCDGEAMLIDGGDSKASSLIYSYLKQHNVSHINHIIATHAHEDHIGGLAGALNFATVDAAYCSVTAYNNEAFSVFEKYLAEQNVNITIPAAGDTFMLGSASVEILAPVKTAIKHNDNSIVLRIVYGNTSFLFTGDAEKEEEHSILDAAYDIQSTVLKVGHHGSDTSTTSSFLQKVSPEYAVISAGMNGYPTNDTLAMLSYSGAEVYRTDLQGTIICTSDGESVSFITEKKDTATQEEVAEYEGYILNTKTKKFHYPSCKSVQQIKEENKLDCTWARETIVDAGYAPCKNCDP